MTDQTFRIGALAGTALIYLGLLGFSVFASGSPRAEDSRRVQRTRPPSVLYHDDDVDVYQRRNVRSGTQRGGGIRGGK